MPHRCPHRRPPHTQTTAPVPLLSHCPSLCTPVLAMYAGSDADPMQTRILPLLATRLPNHLISRTTWNTVQPCPSTRYSFPTIPVHSALCLSSKGIVLTTLLQVRLYYDDITAKSIFFPSVMQQSPPSQSSTPSPPNTYIHPSPPHQTHRLIINESQTPVFRPPSRGRGTAAIKIIDPTTREERRLRQFY
jgi:hypothetical protein